MSQSYARPAPDRVSAGPTTDGPGPALAAATSNEAALGLLAQAAPSAGPASPVLDAAASANAVPLRAPPTPWAEQRRAVSFRDVPGGELFRGGAAPTDVVQGQNGARFLGDCWLLSSLAAVANTQPQLLNDAIKNNGDGSYTVTLRKQGRDGRIESEAIRVTDDVPLTADGRDAYAQRQDPRELWVVLLEKAFASRKGGYGALDGGVPEEALTAITGRPSQTAWAGKDPAATREALRRSASAGVPTVAASRSDISLSSTGIVPGHGHTVMGTEERDGQEYVVLRDPFAKYEPSGNGPRDGVFRVPMSEFGSKFQYVTWSEPEQVPGAASPAPAPVGPQAAPPK